MENIQTLSINVSYITSVARILPLGTPILHLASDEMFAFQHRRKIMPLSTSLNIIVSCSFMFAGETGSHILGNRLEQSMKAMVVTV